MGELRDCVRFVWCIALTRTLGPQDQRPYEASTCSHRVGKLAVQSGLQRVKIERFVPRSQSDDRRVVLAHITVTPSPIV